MYIKKNDLEHSRIGFTVTKKIGNSVVRNKVRRRIREIVRQNLENIMDGYDIVIVPKKNVVDISFKELESAVFHIFKLAGILKSTGENNG